jgi:hypothetical protein
MYSLTDYCACIDKLDIPYPSKKIFWLLHELTTIDENLIWNPDTVLWDGLTRIEFQPTTKMITPIQVHTLINGLVKNQTSAIVTSGAKTAITRIMTKLK